MKLTARHFVVAASVVLLAMSASGCKRADNSSETSGAAAGSSGTMTNPAATGSMGASGPAAASGASQ
ncbi:hypothetical protein HDG38_006000 [Paraburkholderia sp. WSM4177]|nr:hypothetical protein [Paraburkholderia sp. WSM4177]MBB5487902.1 hypothetical protein [Paraburkholderia sp. WSM4180]